MSRLRYLRLAVCLLPAVVLPITSSAQTRLIFSNPTSQQRQEVVEVDYLSVCTSSGIDTTAQIVIRNAAGQEVAYQRTYDGKLLIYLSLHPHGKAVYTLSKGKPAPQKDYVKGKIYPIRKDDLAWENDLGIYRVYGPALQKTGERSFGTDVWVKNTPELVAEARYLKDYEGNLKEDSLRKAGQKDAAQAIDFDTSFHLDHGDGMDAYGVGASLGCGAPGLIIDGELRFPYCYQTCRIHDNGPLRFTAELTYGPNADGLTEHRVISLDRGSHFNRMTVWYDGIKAPVTLAAGVVLHHQDDLILKERYVLYADPTDNSQLHQSQIFVGTLFPNGVDETVMQKGELNHGLGLVRQYTGKPYTYYFGSAWSRYDVRTLAQWQCLADDYLQGLTNPIKIRME